MAYCVCVCVSNEPVGVYYTQWLSSFFYWLSVIQTSLIISGESKFVRLEDVCVEILEPGRKCGNR